MTVVKFTNFLSAASNPTPHFPTIQFPVSFQFPVHLILVVAP